MTVDPATAAGGVRIDPLEAGCRVFRCFAEAFSSPTEAFLDGLFSGAFLHTLAALGEALPYPNPFVLEDLLPEAMSRQDVRVFFATCFEAGGSPVSLRESAYSSRPEKALLEAVLRYYQHFGLGLSQGELREPPDSLAVELEFLHYLAFLELQARGEAGGAENAGALRRARHDFMARHLGAWIRPFMLKLKGVPGNAVYAGLAERLADFVDRELALARTGEEPGLPLPTG